MMQNSSWMKLMQPACAVAGGRGCVAEAGLTGRAFASVHTCGKALAAAGAFVCGSEALRRFLINRSRTFIFNTALRRTFPRKSQPDLRLAATAETERTHVVNLGSFLRNELQGNGFDTAGSDSHLVPSCLERITWRSLLRHACKPAASAFVRFARRRFRVERLACASRLAAKLTQPILADFAGALDPNSQGRLHPLKRFTFPMMDSS